MLKEIHDKLIALTDEELSILNGENSVDRSIYTDYDEGEYLYFKVSERKNIQELLEKIIIELYTNSIMKKATIKLLVGLLLVELVKNSQDIETYSVDNYEKMLIIQSLKYIEEFYSTATLLEVSEN